MMLGGRERRCSGGGGGIPTSCGTGAAIRPEGGGPPDTALPPSVSLKTSA